MIDAAAAALLLALAIDLALGEPPNVVHPVVWMGKLTSALTARAPRRGPARQLAAGVAIAIAVPVVFAAGAAGLLVHVARWPLVELAATALVLKSTFALRELGRAAFVVRDALAANDLPAARGALCSLCSRDPAQLDEQRVTAATVESVAENASDSFVAPLLYFALFGVPGAVAYRAINTLDAMIGYRGRYEYLGKAAARLDDLANLVPARITALLLLVAGGLCRRDMRAGWRVLRRDGGATESPNAGRPMAAMAGLLGVELEKVGHYRLGDPRAPLDAGTITAAWRLVRVAGVLAVVLTLLLSFLVAILLPSALMPGALHV